MDIKTLFFSVVHSAARVLYPSRCLLCGLPGQADLDLCQHCYQQLPFNLTACSRCALPLPENILTGSVCGRCQKKPPYYDDAFSLFSYQQPIIYLIQQLKFKYRLAHARMLGDLLNVAWAKKQVNQHDVCILPVPLYKSRLRQRGFNQSIELARALSKTTGWPMELHRVQRLRETISQTGLDAKERRKNIRGAFKVIESLAQKQVLIIDDVVTTGSTVNELSRVLKQAGVEHVTVLSLARAPLIK